MTSVKYSKVPMEDSEHQGSVSIFDYSSPFTYESKADNNRKYRSVFTYDSDLIQVDQEIKPESQQAIDKMARLLVLFGYCIVYIVTFPVMVWFSFKRIKDNERFVVFRLGHCKGSKGPGMVFMFPMLDRYHKIDVHLKAFSVPPKQIITSDGAIVEVGAEIYHQIIDAEKSVKNVQDLNRSTRVLLQTGLCNILSQKTLAEIEAERRSIADVLMENSNKSCSSWGVEIQRAELSQIKILSEPQPKPAPQLMMPPGLFSPGGMGESLSGMPQAFMQLAKAVIASEGNSAGISEAMMAFQKAQSEETSLENAKGINGTEVAATPLSFEQHSKPLPPLNSDKLLAIIETSLDDTIVGKVGATYQFEIQGEDGGHFYLDLLNGSGSVGRGDLMSGDPDVSINMTMEDFQTMLRSDLSPFHAYMSGRLQVSGDVRVALRLEELMDKLKPHLTRS